MKPYRGFAELIRTQRKAKGMRLDQVAVQVGWSVPYLSELERGIKQPPSPNQGLAKLAEALDLNAQQVNHEAQLSRRSVEIDLDGAGAMQRQLALLLARRIAAGLSDQEAQDLFDRLSAADEDEYAS